MLKITRSILLWFHSVNMDQSRQDVVDAIIQRIIDEIIFELLNINNSVIVQGEIFFSPEKTTAYVSYLMIRKKITRVSNVFSPSPRNDFSTTNTNTWLRKLKKIEILSKSVQILGAETTSNLLFLTGKIIFSLLLLPDSS
jgi:hypothetical protein